MKAGWFGWVCLALTGALPFTAAANPVLALPDIPTHDDGRPPVNSIYTACYQLARHGWKLDIVTYSQPAGTEHDLPVIALRSPEPGPAVWFIAGIHGEEPAGPIALAESADALAELGERRPVVLLPLLNPHGYARNWRYLNRPDWSPEAEALSVGDASHRLPDPEDRMRGRADKASSPEAAAIVQYVLETRREYPPEFSIDLHEDSLLEAGYVYSQGTRGADDPLAVRAVGILETHGIPVKMDGETRFGEAISGGIIGPVIDSSIDELMSAPLIIIGNRLQPGPRSPTVLVFETPAMNLALDLRVAAHRTLVRELATLLAK